jgi:hypothetical protein
VTVDRGGWFIAAPSTRRLRREHTRNATQLVVGVALGVLVHSVRPSVPWQAAQLAAHTRAWRSSPWACAAVIAVASRAKAVSLVLLMFMLALPGVSTVA